MPDSLTRHTIVAAFALLCASLLSAPAARAAGYVYGESQTFRTEGVVSMVDPDRDRVTIAASDGRQYNLDTGDTIVRLRTTNQPGETGDLVVGMHVQVSGQLLSANVVAADTVTVLPYDGNRPVEPTPPYSAREAPAGPALAPPGAEPAVSAGADKHIRLRGTVESVDDDTGMVTVHVRDHDRGVHIDSHTDLTDIPSPDDDHIGLHAGDRVTVRGIMHADGSVYAEAVSLSQDIDAARTEGHNADVDSDHTLVGRVSQESDRLLSRDIKVELEPDHEVTVHVPHDARVMRSGHPISVHDLTTDDVVRVSGSYNGDDFDATKIDVLQTYMDEQ
jgi:hypothetical protein